MDSRGRGGSMLGEAPFSYSLLADDAEAVMRAYDLDDPFVVGHSDGGIAGLRLASRDSVKLSGLVTIASHGCPPSRELLDKVYRPLTAEKWRARFPDWVKLYERLNSKPDFDRLFDKLKAMWINDDKGNYPSDVLDRIKTPTMILCGDKDHLVPRDQTLALAKAVPNATLGLFPFGSHVFHQEHPELVAPFIIRFIEETMKSNSGQREGGNR